VPVTIGIRDGDNVEIAGVADGTRVITTGAGALKDGDRIVGSATDRKPTPTSGGQGAAHPSGQASGQGSGR
jgi:hypothetical protein